MKHFWNPFTKIAGGKALSVGVIGLAVSAICAYFSGLHVHYLMQFGPATRDAWWISALEYLIIWLVPAAVFYGMGAALSRSKVRVIDVFGTTAFALLPIMVMNIWQFVPGAGESIRALGELTTSGSAANDPAAFVAEATEIMIRPLFILSIIVSLAVFIMTVVWLFNAIKVSCNLRGGRLWGTFLVGFIVGGTIICGYLIRFLR